MKRFYKDVTIAPEDGGFAIHLDGKPVKNTARHTLIAPTRALAEEIGKEWAAQVEVIDPETMPLMQILTTALESDRAAIEDEVLGYLNTDLLCYRTLEPVAVRDRQDAQWDKWLRWFEGVSGAAMQVTDSLAALIQPQAAHDYAAAIVKAADDLTFTALQMVTAISGSLILALAFVDGAATPEDVFNAALVEELYRNEIYNEDFYGKAPHQEKSHAGILRDLKALRVFLDATQ